MDSDGQITPMADNERVNKTGKYRVFVRYDGKYIRSSASHLTIQAGEAVSIRLLYRIKNPLTMHYSYVPLLDNIKVDNQ